MNIIVKDLNLKNEISNIKICGESVFYCVVGKDYCNVSIIVNYTPKGTFIDFDLFDEFLKKIGGMQTTREGFCDYLFTKLQEQLDCKKLKVEVFNNDNTRNVIIEKEF